MMLMHQLGRAIVRAASTIALLTVVTGVPAGLAHFVGWPLPHSLPTTVDDLTAFLTSEFNDTAVVNLLTVALWLVWAAFCHALAVEVRAARRGHPARRIRVISPMQALAALLVAGMAAGPSAAAAATVPAVPTVAPSTAGQADPSTGQAVYPVTAWPTTVPATPSRRSATPATAASAPPSVSAVPATMADLPRFALAAHSGPLTVAAAGKQYTVTVQRGDTLWDLADAWLGDPTRWGEIYQLNKDRYDQHGRMHGGDRIYPGQRLNLPDDATPPADARPANPAPPPDRAPSTPTPPPAPAPPTSPPASAGPMPPPASAGPTATPSTSATQAPMDDGVAGVVPTPATATPSSPAPTTSPPASSSPADTNPARPDRPARPGVSLTGDSWVDLGLALAIAGAAALVWRLRRRRYTPRPPRAELPLADPDLAPMPQVVTRVRRGLRAPRHDDSSLNDLLDAADDVTGDLDADADPDGDLTDDADTDLPADAVPPLNLPALGNPMLAAWPPAGLGLTGPGAEAAARGFLTSALAASGVDDPHARSSVIMPAATLATLLGAAAVNVPDTPRLTITGDLNDALETLEELTLHRTRLVYGHEVDTVEQLRDTDPDEEPVPPILLLADATVPHQRARIAALLAQGQRLDIHGVLLGPWPDGDTVVVATDGTTTPADGEGSRHGSHPADVGRLTVLTAAETAALLTTLAESHTGLPQPPAPTEPAPLASADAERPASGTTAMQGHSQVDGVGVGASTAGEPARPETANATDAATPDGDHAATQAPSEADEETEALPATDPAAGDEPDLDDEASDDDAADGPGVVTVQVLGPPTILGADPNDSLRAKALELLVYLIARGGGATTDAMKEDLVPDATVSKAPHRIHTYVYALRKALRRTGGRATYITHPPHRYLINPDTFDIDLWRMRDALTDAETATGEDRITALRCAVAAYTGPLAEGARYEWAEPYREAIRRQALNAHLALAEALTEPGEAIAVLDAAISHDPYAEPLYQAAMRRHADLGDAEAIAGRLTELTRRLEEIDTEPSDETSALAGQLRDDIAHRARRGPRRNRDTAA